MFPPGCLRHYLLTKGEASNSFIGRRTSVAVSSLLTALVLFQVGLGGLTSLALPTVP